MTPFKMSAPITLCASGVALFSAQVSSSVCKIMGPGPDLFPLGPDGKWVLIGSLYKTNQWWVGTMAGNPPRFTPENVGIVDYGNGYAAKTGSTWVQTGSSRRLVFGFTPGS